MPKKFDSADPSSDHSAAVKARLDWATEEERKKLAEIYPLEWDEWLEWYEQEKKKEAES